MAGGRRQRGAIELPKLLLGGLMIIALLLALTWLEGRFDSSDHRKATTLVMTYKASPTGPTIPQAIVRRHPGLKEDDLSWSSEITSSCMGTVRVLAYVPKKANAPSTTYAFDVRLTDPSIHPTDPTTVEILKSLTTSTTATTARTVH
jgi:hypothetical protein